MWKIDFYLNPSDDYGRISYDDALVFDKNIEKLKESDNVLVPTEFYEIMDKNQVCAAEYLFLGEGDDVKTYLSEIITKQSTTSDLYKDINLKGEVGYIIFPSDDAPQGKEAITVKNTVEPNNDITKVKRNYIQKVTTYDNYVERIKVAFPDILFHDNAFDHIKKLGKFSDVVRELTSHLTLLNDFAKKIYDENAGNEEETFRKIKSIYGINCSGKGANESIDYKLECRGVMITCNPHTKFGKGNNDQRIYFSWGRDEIEDHKIIIARIGDHWK